MLGDHHPWQAHALVVTKSEMKLVCGSSRVQQRARGARARYHDPAPMRHFLTSLVLTTALLCSGCGKHTHQAQQYTRDLNAQDSTFEKKDGPFLIFLLLRGTQRTATDGPMVGTSRFTEPPYTLHVSTAYYGDTQDAVEIRQITMRIGDGPRIVVLGEDEPPVAVSFAPWLDHAESANAHFALGDTLPFVEGERVTVDVVFVPPEASEADTLRTVFRGRTKVREIPTLELMLHGS